MAVTAIGFTGTRTTPTPVQAVEIESAIRALRQTGSVFSHGDCVGADEMAHFIAMDLGYTVHVWPPKDNKARAFTTGHFIHAPDAYAVRNACIVMMSDVLLAAPSGPEADNPRSGTWQTVRKARAKGIPITIIYADGSVENEVAPDAALSE